MKTNNRQAWLCVEHGCKFILRADNFQEAYDGAMEYGGHVVGKFDEQTGRTRIAPELVWG